MTAVTTATARRLGDIDEDRGTTLIELLVGMAVMSIFMTIFTGVIVSMARTTTKVEAVTSSAAQVNNAFLRLDKLVRYADAIGAVGTGTSGDQYVELSTVTYAGTVESALCTQLRLDSSLAQLRMRTWSPSASSTTLSPWTSLASNITNGAAATGSGDLPFSAPPALAAASTTFQRLTVTLVAATAGPSSTSTTRTALTFTALNSRVSDATNSTKCQLAAAVYRP